MHLKFVLANMRQQQQEDIVTVELLCELSGRLRLRGHGYGGTRLSRSRGTFEVFKGSHWHHRKAGFSFAPASW